MIQGFLDGLPDQYFQRKQHVVTNLSRARVLNLIQLASRYVFKRFIVDRLENIKLVVCEFFGKDGHGLMKDLLESDSSSTKLRLEFENAFAGEKAFLQASSTSAVAEELPCLIVIVRAFTDALLNSFYAQSVASICVALEAERNGESLLPIVAANRIESTLRKNINTLRTSWDASLCEIMDPGRFLRQSTLLVQFRPAQVPKIIYKQAHHARKSTSSYQAERKQSLLFRPRTAKSPAASARES
mmetsp:Transcript_5421/g.10189  ORF Transcript_5421/g.10189 Transcript_5421/m.10189 type:complete len:243 (+) Transcript_5421:1-729(+)